MKKKLVDLKGGVCQICGYSKCLVALDFHHIEESAKEFELSQRDLTRAWEKIIEEAKNVCWYVLIVTEKFMPGLLCLIRRVVYW